MRSFLTYITDPLLGSFLVSFADVVLHDETVEVHEAKSNGWDPSESFF